SSATRDLHSFPTRRSSDLVTEALFDLALLRVRHRRDLLHADQKAIGHVLVQNADDVRTRKVGTTDCPADLVGRHWLLEGHFDLRSEEHTSELQSRENLVCR